MTTRNRIPRHQVRRLTDTAAVNLIWRRLAGREWSGADDLDYIADVLGETNRVHPGSIEITDEDDTHSDGPADHCIWCGEGIGIIRYGAGDRWQPTPALGDDFCEVRWDETPDKPAMYCEESIARESGEFRHDVKEA